CPFRSRVTLKETSPSLYLASSMAVSWLFRPTMAPVNLSPSNFSLRVVSRVWPPASTFHFQVPVGFGLSSASAPPTSPGKASTNTTATSRFIASPPKFEVGRGSLLIPRRAVPPVHWPHIDQPRGHSEVPRGFAIPRSNARTSLWTIRGVYHLKGKE